MSGKVQEPLGGTSSLNAIRISSTGHRQGMLSDAGAGCKARRRMPLRINHQQKTLGCPILL